MREKNKPTKQRAKAERLWDEWLTEDFKKCKICGKKGIVRWSIGEDGNSFCTCSLILKL